MPAPQYCGAVITYRTHSGGCHELDRQSSRRSLSVPHLSRAARQLAAVIAKNFSATNARYASFYDTDAISDMHTTSGAVRYARYELMRHGYLVEMQYGSGRPSYSLRFGHSMAPLSDEVA